MFQPCALIGCEYFLAQFRQSLTLFRVSVTITPQILGLHGVVDSRIAEHEETV